MLRRPIYYVHPQVLQNDDTSVTTSNARGLQKNKKDISLFRKVVNTRISYLSVENEYWPKLVYIFIFMFSHHEILGL